LKKKIFIAEMEDVELEFLIKNGDFYWKN